MSWRREPSRNLCRLASSIPLEQLGIGDTVEIVGLGMTGSLLEIPQGKNAYGLKLGKGKYWRLSGAFSVWQANRFPRRLLHHRKVPVGFQLAEDWGSTNRRWWTCEGRPLMRHSIRSSRRSDRRLSMGAVPSDYPSVVGRSTQVRLARILEESPYVAEFRPGDRAEGGDGATVARLR